MAGKKGSGESSKKAAGNARKAEAAAQKAAVNDARQEAAEADKWEKGAKDSSKKEVEVSKKADAARKKAEREALLAEEEASTPGRTQPKNAKTAVKKSKGLDLSQLEGTAPDGPLAALSASGIDNALDALSLTAASSSDLKIDRHPERRFKAAYSAFEERRLKEMDGDGSGQGLRLNQRKAQVKKEFERSSENPFNQATANYDASREDMANIRGQEKAKVESRLGEK